jgi:hypothetical protein
VQQVRLLAYAADSQQHEIYECQIDTPQAGFNAVIFTEHTRDVWSASLTQHHQRAHAVVPCKEQDANVLIIQIEAKHVLRCPIFIGAAVAYMSPAGTLTYLFYLLHLALQCGP